MSTPDRRALVDRGHEGLSVRRQCALLGLARSGVYRPPAPANDDDLALMRRLDELFTAWPFLGSRRLALMLGSPGRPVNRKRLRRLMRQMGIAALGPWFDKLTMRAADHEVGAGPQDIPLPAAQPGDRAAEPGVGSGHPLCADRTRLFSISSRWWTGRAAPCFQRLWRSLKYEDIYLKGYADGREAKAGIALWFAFYNAERPHQALANRTPMVVWREGTTGALGDRAVEMTLVLRTSLDNAGALPTCPQPPQQQEGLLA
jgi:putative transposase